MRKIVSCLLLLSLLVTSAGGNVFAAGQGERAAGTPAAETGGRASEAVRIEVRNKDGKVLASGENELTYQGTYSYGNDAIVFQAPEGVKHLVIQTDEYTGIPAVEGEEPAGAKNETEARANLSYTYGESIVYAPEGEVYFTVPYPSDYSDANNFSPYDPRAFAGNAHKITARVATDDEIYARRNLAVNPFDNYETKPNYASGPIHYNQHYNKSFYPHAIANTVTRDELRFVPRNAIDGFELNNWHSFFPYQSWAGGARSDLNFSILFGRTVEIDSVDLYVRAQWSDGHDAYWNRAVLEFSDGTEQVIELKQTNEVQHFDLGGKKRVSWVHLKELEQPGPNLGFAALTEMKVYGQEIRGNEVQDLPSPEHILNIAKRVDDYWINLNGSDLRNHEWNNAVYHTGNMELYYLTGDENYKNYSEAWAKRMNWLGNSNYDDGSWEYAHGLHADNHTQYQTYIDLYNLAPEDKKIQIAKYVIDKQMATNNKTQWYWVDALYMGMPVYMKLALLTGEQKYLDWMFEMFHYTEKELAGSGLFNEEDGLWYRDSKYIYPNGSHSQSSNGKKVYWARGDGWAIAALAKVLQDLPDSDTHRGEYERVFKVMAESLLKLQGDDGFWRRNLGDYDDLPQPETSGTAFYTYAFAWGINNGLLDRETYLPAVKKAFHAMDAVAIHPTGRVGRVQPIGENPDPNQDIGYARTQDFGVGAVLLMLSEISKLERGIVDGDLQPMLEKRMVNAVGVKAGSDNALVGTTYGGRACHVEKMSGAAVEKDGKIYIPKDFAVNTWKVSSAQDKITQNKMEYFSMEDVAKSLGKALYRKDKICVMAHRRQLFSDSQDAALVTLLGKVLDQGAFPERPEYVSRFEYFLPPVPENHVPVTGISASAVPEAANVPANVLDRSLNTRWSAEANPNTNTAQWIMAEFDEAPVKKIGVAFYQGTQRTTEYKIELKRPAGDWVTVKEQGDSLGNKAGFEYTEFEPVDAVAVRVTGYKNSTSNWVSISGLEVIAAQRYPEGTWHPYFSTNDWSVKDLGSGNTGIQEMEFKIHPMEDKQDGAVFYTGADALLTDWGHAPIAIRLNTSGNFDARNGGAYEAKNTIAYKANTTYSVKVTADIDKKTYSAYVTGPDGVTRTLAENYNFRTGAQAVSDIGKICVRGGSNVAAGKFAILSHKMPKREQKPLECTVTFDAAGGMVAPAQIRVEKGKTLQQLPVPARTGYEFKGWYTAVNGGGTKVTQNTAINIDSVLYAHWEKKAEPKKLKKGQTFTSGKLKYKVTKAVSGKKKGEVALVGYNKKSSDKKLTVKETVTASSGRGTFYVTQIASKAFKGNKKLETLTIGKRVATLGSEAFYGCSRLKAVKGGSGVKTVGTGTFGKCTSLKKITMGSKVQSIGAKAFEGCKKLGTITIQSKKLKKVGSKAISGIKKNAVIKVPAKKVSSCKKLFKSKTGYKKTMKIKK